jgi:hypothetical protein
MDEKSNKKEPTYLERTQYSVNRIFVDINSRNSSKSGLPGSEQSITNGQQKKRKKYCSQRCHSHSSVGRFAANEGCSVE